MAYLPNSIFKATTDISKSFLLRFFYGLVSKIRPTGIKPKQGFQGRNVVVLGSEQVLALLS